MEMRFSVTLLAADGSRRVWKFGGGTAVLGTEVGCEVAVEGQGIWGRHARVEFEDLGIWVEDLGSEYGTVLDGSRIRQREWASYPASLRIGELSFAVQGVRRVRGAGETTRSGGGQQLSLGFVSEKGVGLAGLSARMPGEYSLKREISRGGMARIFEGEDRLLNRTIAVKVGNEIAGALDGDPDRDALFFREAQILGRLAHPNIVPVYGCGRDAIGRPVYGMKLVNGSTLEEILGGLRRGDPELRFQFSRDQLLTVFLKVCDAIRFAHAMGILHRDLKPENVMVGEFGEVLVMDWGLAKVMGEREGEAAERGATRGRVGLRDDLAATMDGDVVGSPRYMSPEQASGRVADLDERTDIYALGGILYAILSYGPPVDGDSVNEVLRRVRAGEITPIKEALRGLEAEDWGQSRPGAVPPALEAVAMKALALAREDRYESVSELVSEIQSFQSGFATEAEGAKFGRQVVLLLMRNRSEAILFGILALVLGVFMLQLAANRQRLADEVVKAEDTARRASASEDLAKENEQVALGEREKQRMAAAEAQIAVAEAAEERLDGKGMEDALAKVPEDLRSRFSSWEYIHRRLTESDQTMEAGAGGAFVSILPEKGKSSSVLALQSRGRIRRYSLKTGASKELFDLSTGLEETDWEWRRAALSGDGGTMAVVGVQGKSLVEIHLWRVGDWQLLGRIAPEKEPRTVALNEDGRFLLVDPNRVWSFGRKALMQMWEVASGRLSWSREASNNSFALFDPTDSEGTRVLGFEWDDVAGKPWLRAWDGASGRLLEESLAKSSQAMAGSVFSEFLTTIARDELSFYTARSNTLSKIRRSDGEVSFQWKVPVGELRSIHVLEKGVLATLTKSSDRVGVVQFWDAAQGRPIKSGFFSAEKPWGGWKAVVHPTSHELVVYEGNRLKVWTCEAPRVLGALSGQAGDLFVGSDFLGDQSRVIRLKRNNVTQRSELEFWDASGKRPERMETDAPLFSQVARSLSVDRVSGRFCLQLSEAVQLWEWAPGAVHMLREWSFKSAPRNVLLSPRGGRVLVDREVFDTSDGRRVSVLESEHFDSLEFPESQIRSWPVVRWLDADRVLQIMITREAPADGSSQRQGRALVVWDVRTGRVERHVTALNAQTLSVSVDGRWVVEGGLDRKARIRDALTLEVMGEFRTHDEVLTSAVFHPTAPLFVTASEDRSIRIWRRDTGKMVEELGRFRAVPESLTISGDGQMLGVTLRGTRNFQFMRPASFESSLR
jgi:serine/threonine protein kinase/WD40 repeat protein